MKKLSNKVAAITGAGSGIGRSLAINLAQEGCHLALSDINQEDVAETAKMLKGYPVKVTHGKLDVSDQKEMFSWADQVVEEHGKVNLIFNNAGVGLAGTVESSKMEDIEWVMGINFWGTVYGVKAFIPHLQASKEGCIINISSVVGLASLPFSSAYNASKFAVRGFSESLSQELNLSHSNKLNLTCVYPGGIKTNIAKTARRDSSMDDLTEKWEGMFMTSPDKAARTILKGVKNNKRRVLIGPDSYFLDGITRLTPRGYQWLSVRSVEKFMQKI